MEYINYVRITMNYPDKINKQPELIYGPSGIGKSYFIDANWAKEDREAEGIGWTADARKVIPYWLEKKYTRVIVLGVPHLIWIQRIKERSIKDPRRRSVIARFHDENDFKESYVKSIKQLDDNNIPYILIDNRNNYPILDKSSFFTMLTEKYLQLSPETL